MTVEGELLDRRSVQVAGALQEMAVVSWSSHQSPSTGVNGWYSNRGTFRTPAEACV